MSDSKVDLCRCYNPYRDTQCFRIHFNMPPRELKWLKVLNCPKITGLVLCKVYYRLPFPYCSKPWGTEYLPQVYRWGRRSACCPYWGHLARPDGLYGTVSGPHSLWRKGSWYRLISDRQATLEIGHTKGRLLPIIKYTSLKSISPQFCVTVYMLILKRMFPHTGALHRATLLQFTCHNCYILDLVAP